MTSTETPQGPQTDTLQQPQQPQSQGRRRKKEILTGNKVQTFGRKKHAIAVAVVAEGYGMIRVNGRPLDLVEPKPMRLKLYEPVLLVGVKEFENIDIHIRVRGGGHVAQIYAVRQAIAKALLAWNAKYVDENNKEKLKKSFLNYDKQLLVADPRRREPKKFGGPGARARYQKSYR